MVDSEGPALSLPERLQGGVFWGLASSVRVQGLGFRV